MISIKEVTKHYNKLKVLDNVSAEWTGPAVYALVGPNACGKTTLIKSILGLVLPEKGEILVNGKLITEDCNYRSNIGYMPQIGRYPANLSIGQLLDMVKSLRKNKGETVDEELIYEFNINSLRDKKMNALSGGTTQKISAAIAFMFNAPILILDEPTAGLDPISSEILKEKIIRERNKGKLILITTHLLSELNEVVDHIAFMNEGRIKFSKTKEEILEESQSGSLSKALINILKNHQ